MALNEIHLFIVPELPVLGVASANPNPLRREGFSFAFRGERMAYPLSRLPASLGTAVTEKT